MVLDTSMFPKEDLKYLDKGHTGVPIGWGDRPALVIVDMTRAFVEDEYPLACEKTARPCVSAIARMLKASRNAKIPVLFTQGIVADKEIIRGRWKSRFEDPLLNSPRAHEIVEEIAPLADEVVVRKTFFVLQPSNCIRYKRTGLLENMETGNVLGKRYRYRCVTRWKIE